MMALNKAMKPLDNYPGLQVNLTVTSNPVIKEDFISLPFDGSFISIKN
jgi:hypothetical protein